MHVARALYIFTLKYDLSDMCVFAASHYSFMAPFLERRFLTNYFQTDAGMQND